MLEFHIPIDEVYDEETNCFYSICGHNLRFEHSLLSMSKWEEKYKKPFFTTQMTPEESIDYFRMMSLDANFDDSFFSQALFEKSSE